MIRRIESKAVGSVGRRVAVALATGLFLLGTSAAVYATSTGPDFSVTVSPSSQTMVAGYTTPPPGYSASYTVMISPSNGFQGPVTLSVSNLPKSSSQMTVSWTVGGTTTSTTTTTGGPVTAQAVTVPPGSLGVAATLTIGGGQPAAGTYTATVTATPLNGTAHTAAMTFTVVSQNSAYFGLWMSPSAQTTVQGAATPVSSTINIARLNWTGSVSFPATSSVSGLPSGATASISPTSTTGSTATLSISTASSTPPGLYPITVSGSGATSSKTTLTQATSFVLNVQAATAISATAATVAAPNMTVTPSSAVSAATNAATGTITFKVFGPSATPPTSCPNSTNSTGWATVGTAPVNGPGTYTPSSGYQLTQSGGTYWWYASYSGDTYNTASTSRCGSGMASTVVQDFSIGTSGSTSQAALTGGTSDDSASYTTTVSPIGGYPGTVALSVSGLPSGASASFGPNPASGTSTLTIDVGTSVRQGTYTLTVQGQATIAGTTVTHSNPTPLTLVVNPSQPFTISGNVPAPLFPGGAAQTFTVILTNPNSFPIKVTNLGSVSVAAPNAPGCLSSWFKVTLPTATQSSPISVPANSSVNTQATAQMLDVNGPQDACKGQQLHLTYSGSYTK